MPRRRYSHPVSRYQEDRSPFGCLLTLIVIGMIAGTGVYFWSTQPDDDADNMDDTIAALETSSALLEGAGKSDAAPTSGPVNAANDADIAQSATADVASSLSNESRSRRIFFPATGTVGRIVTARKVPGSWDVANLQDLVGHLEGTSWLGETGNTVLAGHFEDELGNPGPFRYLYDAEVGDTILIQDGAGEPMQIYEVTRVFSTDPEDIEILRTTEEPQLTLITCDDWNPSRETYDERRVVVAKPTGQQTTSSDGFD